MTELLRVGVLGAGWAGELHLEAFRSQPEVELVALCSRTKSTAEAVAERYGVAKVVDDIDDFFGSDLDIISIATPPSSHVELTLRALASGAHVLCDKPTALTGVQAAEVYQAAEAAGVRHASGYIWRNDPAILHIRQLVAQGAICRITDVQVRCALGAPVLPMTWMYDEKA